jgi:cytochrome c553
MRAPEVEAMRRSGRQAVALAAALSVVCAAGCGPRGAPEVPSAAGVPDFERDVAPILAARCVSCHGPEEQESFLRLDSYAEARKGGLSGSVIVPGNGPGSLIVQHLTGEARPRMPDAKPPLPSDEIALITAWIDAGAPGPGGAAQAAGAPQPRHWAYGPPVRPPAPPVRDLDWVRSPIDAFVLARLEAEGLAPSAEADRETLIRRLSLDLVGLPPTPKEIDAFLADGSAGAYEGVVDRLLGSPHYGERWARPWLDLARYADSNGYEKDRPRVAWVYRDWVIDALNRDMSFRDFTVEQLAGDMLDGATTEQKIATGFNRNSQLNQEGGIDVEEQRFESLVDRVNTTSTVWLGSTIGCAQCHNHKFDSFSQKDYYRLMAFFDNGVYSVHGVGDEVVDKWVHEPELDLPTPEQEKQRTALRLEADTLRFEIETGDLSDDLAAFEREIAAPPPAFTPLEVVSFEAESEAGFELLEDGSIRVTGDLKKSTDTYTLTLRTALPRVTAFRLEALPDPSLPRGGPGRASSGAFVVTRITVSEGDRPLPLVRAAADAADPTRTAALALDAHSSTGWGVTTEAKLGRPHYAILAAEEPPSGARAASTKGHAGKRVLTFHLEFKARFPLVRSALGRFRLSATDSSHPFGGLSTPDEIRGLLDTPPAERTATEREELLAWFRPRAPSLDAARDRLRTIPIELKEMKVLTALVMEERPGFELPSTLFRERGSFMSPGERVYAAIPAALGSLAMDQPPNRLGLARWLVDEDNPLTARVAVNRLWETLFGRGLVLTSEDFGTQGERPSHPELLDWLAVEFVEGGWSQKALLRKIVTSATYRQSSSTSAALLERDPANRLLARGARYRVEAEMIRDMALAISGLLSPTIGGPSVYPVQPEGVWNVPYSDFRWETSTGEGLHRRSLYTFWRRTSPYPSMVTFDAPSRELCAVRRVPTNTPLQALTTLNDPVFVEAARALAGRMATEGGASPVEKIGHGHRLCTARQPGADDLADLVAFYERESDRFGRDDEAARALLAADAEGPDSAERAALTSVASVLLNLDATLTRE